MEKSKTDHALALIKAGISGVPVIGGAIASLLSDYVPFSTQRAIEETIEILKARLCKIEARVDLDKIDKDQFSELFKSCYLVVIRTNQKRKLQAAAELIANILLKDGDKEKLSYKELDHYVRCLDSLSIGALDVLGVALKIARKDRATYLEKSSYIFDFKRLGPEFQEASPSLLMGLVGELNSMGLLRINKIPTVTVEDYGNYPLELTALGSQFVMHLLEPKPSTN